MHVLVYIFNEGLVLCAVVKQEKHPFSRPLTDVEREGNTI